MNYNDYVRSSLELHLFFDRIMKEHSLFLKVAFLERDKEYQKIAKEFEKSFTKILKDMVKLADGNVSREFLNVGEIVTKNTKNAEEKTSTLTGSDIRTDITMDELNLRSGTIRVTEELVNRIHRINRQTLELVENLIHFKGEILKHVLACEMYTANYPLLIQHIMNEAKMYHSLLLKIENGGLFSQSELYEQEVFWNNIMMEHAEFIRGLLDPSEEQLILTADQYANDYKTLLQSYQRNFYDLTRESLQKTIPFRDFKVAGEEGILNCKIKSIIIPLLADHVVREANHFIRILKSLQTRV